MSTERPARDTDVSEPARAALIDAVQRNCDRADAHHAQDLSLCTYLLQMREFFRWDSGLPLLAAPDRAAVGRWIAARERHWQSLDDAGPHDFDTLPLPDRVDPFDEAAVNDVLRPQRLLYGAGYGRFGHAQFFLAEQIGERECEGARVIIAGAEYARGLSPALAASRGDTIVVRRDAVRRWLGTKLELADPADRGDPLIESAHAAGATACDAAQRLELLTGQAVEVMVLHELGERRAGDLLGAQWEVMLASLHDRRAELVARAVRDLLADCLVTLPALLADEARAGIPFWFASLDGLQRQFAPTWPQAYRDWRDGDPQPLRRAAREGGDRWLAASRALLDAWHAAGAERVRAHRWLQDAPHASL
jgi:hypothetical protein